MSLASAIWGFDALKSRLGFEHNSLANSESLKNVHQKMNLVKIDDRKMILRTLLQEYEKLCEMRHSIVHAHCAITGKNAVALSISPNEEPLVFKTDAALIESCASLALSMGRAFHQEIFYEICRRWVQDWPSNIDAANSMTKEGAKKKIKAEFSTTRVV